MNRRLIMLSVLPFLLSAPPAGAQSAAMETTDPGTVIGWRSFIGTSPGATAGWSFEVGGRDLTVITLGIFDDNGDGLLSAHRTGIWNSGGELLADVTVPGGTEGALSGGYRYTPVAPLTLTAGSVYTVGAFYEGGGNEAVNILSSQTFSAEVTYLQSRQSQQFTPFTFPGLNAGVSQGVFGPNFQFIPVPEPSSALIGLGAAALGLRRGRRAARV